MCNWKKDYMTCKRILGIETNFEDTESFDDYEFNPKISFFDYDTVIINIRNILYHYDEDRISPYGEHKLLSRNSSLKIKSDFKKLKENIEEYLATGKIVYIIMHDLSNIAIYADKQTETSSKTKPNTIYVDIFNTYSFLPFQINIQSLIGEEISYIAPAPYSDFFISLKDYFYYNVSFSSNVINTLATIKNNKNKIVSSVTNYKNGKLVLLPSIYNESDFKTQKALKDFQSLFLNNIITLTNSLMNDNNQVLPEWTNNIQILDEANILSDISKDQKKIEKLEQQLTLKKNELKKLQSYKYLLTSTGKNLENIVKKTLCELEFEILDSEENRSDVIARYKDIDIVIEIKGLTKSAAEKNSAQLEKWASEFMENNGREPKAILIVNGYCELPLDQRIEPVFPNQMLKYAEKKDQCLLSTTQLLLLFLDIRNNPQNKDIIVNELLNTVGVYNKYKVNELIK